MRFVSICVSKSQEDNGYGGGKSTIAERVDGGTTRENDQEALQTLSK